MGSLDNKTKENVTKSDLIIGLVTLAIIWFVIIQVLGWIGGVVGDVFSSEPSNNAKTSNSEVVTYDNCRTEVVHFTTKNEGKETDDALKEVKQAGKNGSRKVCEASVAGYEDKITIVEESTEEVVLYTPPPPPAPAPAPVQSFTTPAPSPPPSPEPTPAPVQTNNARTGARCRDGSYSSATGRGACSHHGGVAQWLY